MIHIFATVIVTIWIMALVAPIIIAVWDTIEDYFRKY